MNKKIIFISLSMFTLFFGNICYSALPDYVIVDRICSSPIKAIAMTGKIEDINYNSKDYYHHKKVVFHIKQYFQKSSNEDKLIGYFDVINEKYKRMPMPGGPHSFSNIAERDSVFITLDESNEITSYTLITPELKEILINYPNKIGINIKNRFVYILKENEKKEFNYNVFESIKKINDTQ